LSEVSFQEHNLLSLLLYQGGGACADAMQ